MTTHILIELDHPPFEVTRESVKNPPDWAGRLPFFNDCFALLEHGPKLGEYGHYLIAYRGKIEVWPPEDVAKYLKQNPYEACASTKVERKRAMASHDYEMDWISGLIAKRRAIRQLEQKELGK